MELGNGMHHVGLNKEQFMICDTIQSPDGAQLYFGSHLKPFFLLEEMFKISFSYICNSECKESKLEQPKLEPDSILNFSQHS